jgi:hypothetical protein
MANLYVLEGRGTGVYSESARRRGIRRVTRMRRVPGIVYGDPMQVLLGRSFFKKIGSGLKAATKVAISPVTATYSVTKSAAKATVKAVKDPSLKNISKIVTNPLVRAKGEVVKTGKDAGHAVMETGRAGSVALDVTRRVAKRLIKKVAKKVLFKGDDLLGSVSAIPKNAAKGVLIPVATAAVLANTVTAPAAPAVPVLVNEVINELYSAMENAIKKGLSPEKAAKAAQDQLDVLEPGEENDPKVGYGSFMPIAIGIAAVLALVVVLKKK